MRTARFAETLDDLVRQVYHVDSLRWRDHPAFKKDLPFMVHNLEYLTFSLSSEWPDDPGIRRVAKRVNLRAARLLEKSRAVPHEIADWRPTADHIVANYEILRFEAGHLYKLVRPESPFGVLKSAL